MTLDQAAMIIMHLDNISIKLVIVIALLGAIFVWGLRK